MKLINIFKNIWSIKELREKLLFTFGLLLVYRFGSYIILPGIDGGEIFAAIDKSIAESQGSSKSILDVINSFTGGALSRGSILALGIMPYISASIIVQLAGLAIPYLQKLDKEGESGFKKKTQLTRWLTIAICLVQVGPYLTLLTTQLLPYQDPNFTNVYLYEPSSFWFWFPASIILVCGTVFTMWLGEKITDKGIGNGISILIMIGILADFPGALISTANQIPAIFFVLIIVGLLIAIMLSVILVAAVRRVPVQYVRRAQAGAKSGSGFMRSVTDSVRSYIPLKVNAAGVMPIIFAQAVMFLPGLLAGSETVTSLPYVGGFVSDLAQPFSFSYNLVFGILIILFTFFYTAITIPVNKMADDLKRNGGIIPGIKPGKDTADYLDEILSRITLPGSIFLALLAVLPAFVKLVDVPDALAIFFGGTSLLIMVGVILDTVQQINTYLLNHHYDGLMQTGRTSKVA